MNHSTCEHGVYLFHSCSRCVDRAKARINMDREKLEAQWSPDFTPTPNEVAVDKAWEKFEP